MLRPPAATTLQSLRVRIGLAWLPIPVLLAVIVGLWVADLHTGYESPLLLVLTNLVFTWLVSVCIGLVAGRSFLASGKWDLLLLGCGALFWGFATLLAGALVSHGGNVTITIHNLGVLGSAGCHLAGLFWCGKAHHSPPTTRHSRLLWLIASYAGVLLVVALLVWAATTGRTPVFFAQGQGGTPLRQAVLGLIMAMLILTALLLLRAHRWKPAGFLYYYALGLALLATGLLGVWLQSVHGSVLGWTGRITQCLGGAYLFVAALAAARDTGDWKISLASMEERWRNGDLLPTMRKEPMLWLALHYGTALVAVAAGWGLRGALTTLIGPGLPPYITFYPAVMVSALVGGFGPGMLATGLTGASAWYWLLPPVGQFAIHSPVDRMGLVLFTCMGLFVSVISELYRRAREKATAYDQEQALRDIRREKELLADLLEHAGQPFAVGYPDGRIGRLNRAYEQLTGYSAAELRALDWSGVLTPPEWRELENQKLGELKRTGQPVRYEKEYIRKDGSRVPVELLVHLARDGKGKPEYYYSFLTDITGRKQAETALRNRAEEALRLSEQEFRSLAESMPQIVWATRPDGWNVYFNQQWVDYTGMTLEESYGHGWNTPFHPDDKQRAWEAWQRATQHNERYSLECRLRRADGVYRWWLIRGEPMRGANGEILKWFGTCTDIEEIKNAEAVLREANELLEQRVAERTAALAESADRLRLAQQGARLGAFEWNLQTNVNDWSPELEAMYGLAPGEFGKTQPAWEQLVHPEDRAAAVELCNQTFETGEPVEGEWRAIWPDGSVHWIAGRFQAFKDAAGKPRILSGVNMDITERKQVEAKLRESESLYRGIGESIDYGVWVCGPDGRNTYASESFLKMVGLTQEQCSNFGWGGVLHPDDAERTIAAWKECVHTGGKWDIEHRFRGVDGQWHHVLARGVPIKNDRGEITCWAGINLDITRLKVAEEVIRASLAEKEVLLREIHHRVKNNMQVLSSLVSLQAQQVTDPAVLTALADTRDRVRSMALVHEKLYQSENLAAVDFAAYAESLLHTLWRAHAPQAVVHLKLALEPVTLTVESAVPCGLILNELVANSLKHAFRGRDEGTITVTMRPEPDGRVSLRVSDNGIGLPADFDWRQAQSLGLRLVQMLSKQIKGTAEARRSDGGGTEFEIRFAESIPNG